MTEFRISKANEDQMLVFGWAQVSAAANGELLTDWQGDIVKPQELEDAAYQFVLFFRDVGERHDTALRKKGRLVESVVFTAEKLEAMGIPEGMVPLGWWVGFKIDDLDTWQKIKSGAYQMFSVEGEGERYPVAKCFREILKEYQG